MHVYEVGQPYIAGQTQWQQGPVYNYSRNGHELLIVLDRPSAEEIQGVRFEKAEFALLIERDALFFLSQFGNEPGSGLPWQDAPYNYWLNKPEVRTLPDPEPVVGEQASLQVLLVDARTGLILALRMVSLSAEFTGVLNKAIRQQARTAWNGSQAYDKALSRLYRKYPAVGSMLAQAEIWCVSGEAPETPTGETNEFRDKGPTNDLCFAINHYVSTGEFIGQGTVFERDGKMDFAIPYNPDNLEDASNMAKLRVRIAEIADETGISLVLEDMGRFGDFVLVMLPVKAEDLKRVAQELLRFPGAADWGSGKASIDLYFPGVKERILAGR